MMSNYKNDYPEPEELDTISLDELADMLNAELEEDEPEFLEPDDGEELEFNDDKRHRGWR
jgi:hypothetical protein